MEGQEAIVDCPFCGEPMSLLIDDMSDNQSYIEDCSVCCRPIQLRIRCKDGELIEVLADRS